jgi:DHA1 family inner membrane transport protein
VTLANVLGVPAGACIGNAYGWQAPFWVVALLGILAILAIYIFVPSISGEKTTSFRDQLLAFRNGQLWLSLAITVFSWAAFMTFYAYIAPVSEYLAGYTPRGLTVLLIALGIGLVVGNSLGGRAADVNLGLALIGGIILMSLSLIIVGFSTNYMWIFFFASLLFGIVSFFNVPPLQMRVMRYAGKAPELAATANISAFNLANAIGGVIGGYIIDNPEIGIEKLPFIAAAVPLPGILLALMGQFMENRQSTDK